MSFLGGVGRCVGWDSERVGALRADRVCLCCLWPKLPVPIELCNSDSFECNNENAKGLDI